MEREFQSFLVNMDVAAANDMLKRIKPAVPTRAGQLPVLSGVLIEALPKNRVRFTGSDLDLTLRVSNDAHIRVGTPVVVPFRTFKKVVDTAKKGELTLEAVDAKTVAIGAGRTIVKAPGWAHDEWPSTPSMFSDGEPGEADIDFDLLASLLPAVSTDDNRPIITSVEVTGNTYAATDSYRLYVTTLNTGTTGLTGPVLLPRRFVQEAIKWGGVQRIQYNDKHVFFSSAGYEMTARVVFGEFPNWKALLPGVPPVLFAFDSHAEFVATLKELRAMASAIRSDAPLRITRDPEFTNNVILSIGNTDYGIVEASLKGHLPNVSPIAFNPTYLAELLDGFETTTLYGVDGQKPAVGIIEEDNVTRQRLLMPVRIN